MLWTNPSPTAATVAVSADSTQTFPLPIQDTSNTASNAAFAKCFLNSGTCPSTGTFPIADVKIDDGTPSGAAIDSSWMIITQSATNSQTIEIKPRLASHIGTHKIKVIFDSLHGPNPTYEALTITVTCQVTSVAPPAAPSVGDASLTYTVYDPTNISHDYSAATWV
jgi:hypothetical protein